jgi:crotonobetainyl-CoA:carnitine CoA-transferase CaiB-like acyl-CoA transferase
VRRNAKKKSSKRTKRPSGPLAGIRVLDFSSYIAGPYGCSLLADLGAEVIKIEAPAGDTLRHYPSTLAQESRAFLGVNRSKRSIVIDAKRRESAPVLRRLVKTADVVVHNFRPSVPARLGLDYDTLQKIKPQLIYCALTGYGDDGPLKDKAGFDQVLQSMTGICRFQGSQDKAEIVMGSVVDFYAAASIAYGVSAALYHQKHTGKGQYVGISLLASALAMQSGRFIWAESEPRDANRDLRSGGITGIHPTRSGEIYISANTPHFWQSLCEIVGLPELAADPNYDSVRKRAQRASEIVPKIRAALMTKRALEWEQLFGERVPCGAVRPMEEMFDHQQVIAQGLAHSFHHRSIGHYTGIANPIRFSASGGSEPFAAPTLGEHTDEILKRLGFSQRKVAALRKAGVLAPAPAPADQGSV